MEARKLARTNYAVRTVAFAYAAIPIVLHLQPQQPATAAWVLLALQFIAYPHLAYLRARASARKCSASAGMSSRRSRSAGTSITTPCNRYSRS